MKRDKELSKVGQGFNDARGEIDDKKDIPKGNGQNVNNDPTHRRANEIPPAPTATTRKVKNNK